MNQKKKLVLTIAMVIFALYLNRKKSYELWTIDHGPNNMHTITNLYPATVAASALNVRQTLTPNASAAWCNSR
jgi:hypothetical protein